MGYLCNGCVSNEAAIGAATHSTTRVREWVVGSVKCNCKSNSGLPLPNRQTWWRAAVVMMLRTTVAV